MAGEQSDLDRNEDASAHKLEKAHERGSIVKSAEVTFAVILLAATACIYGLSHSTLQQAGDLLAKGLLSSGRASMGAQATTHLAHSLASLALQLAAPLLFVIWTAAALTGALQARGVLTTKPLQPDFNRLNPVKGLERLFSIKSVFDLLRNSLKLAVMAVATVSWGTHHLQDVLAMQGISARSQAYLITQLIGGAFGLAAALFILFAAIDWMFNRWDFARQMRMSKREIKDEHKEREGDPRIKSRLRELRMEWLRRARSVSKVKSADVLLTNPTHYSVALQYRHGDTPAPLIIAKGAGELALRMREEARRRQVPIVENPPLARALFKVPGAEPLVPEAHFQDVARILRWVYARRRRQPSQASA
ncbi:MAG: EscU/YscU/HrcU family type III secretion system export apparatus switch protein [Burkholderiales bacterium]|jgi:flagellar biosynthesis protein FlhB|nr:EscU/YscU/HrcU family type III secretion system export apparatus switch protein [Burkholderiales bacterium]